ncbi:MAG TPA: alpha/beta hydrolase [Streptosporangiaceae bacterium]|nr:alpha/beta hydrolase [Streptosporangiaceae bacterium]
MSERIVVSRPGGELIGERWAGPGPVVVLLHEGVTDRRGWAEVARLLSGTATVVAYDRRAFGESAPGTEAFTHVDDLLAVLDEVADGKVWLVGASAGGGVALDAALVAPDRVAGLVLFAPAVSGAPEPEFDDATRRLGELYDKAEAAGDKAELNRLETWIWLDGPGEPEGRVSGPARELALDMNGIVLRNDVPEDAGASGVDAWSRLSEVTVLVTVACGDLDASFLVSSSRELAERLPQGRHRVLPGVAHMPFLEQPGLVAAIIEDATQQSF